MGKKLSIGLALIIVLGLNACLVIENPYSGIAPGQWRAVLKLSPDYITPNPKGKPLPEKLNFNRTSP